MDDFAVEEQRKRERCFALIEGLSGASLVDALETLREIVAPVTLVAPWPWSRSRSAVEGAVAERRVEEGH
jgi:hypothetical protein